MSAQLTLSSLIFCLALAGCHRGQPVAEPGGDDHGADSGAEALAGYPGELISTAELHGDFMARQKLSGRFGEREFAFEAVLQLSGGTLTVLGLTPFGTKAFVLTQTGTEVEFRPLIERELPFPPDYILQDIHRAWLWSARLPWGDQAPAQGESVVEVAGERVEERWGEGGLESRSFERLDGAPAGKIVIDYIGGHRAEAPAKEVVLVNGWFGYELRIETVEWRAL